MGLFFVGRSKFTLFWRIGLRSLDFRISFFFLILRRMGKNKA